LSIYDIEIKLLSSVADKTVKKSAATAAAEVVKERYGKQN
jgi:hypothetical protein